MNTLNSFEGGSARFPHRDEEVVESAGPGFCGPNEAEVGFLLPQLLSSPGCPSRSRAVAFGAALVRWFRGVQQPEGTQT